MLYLEDNKFYVKVNGGYREVEIIVEDGAFGFNAKGEVVQLNDNLPSYNIEELVAQYHLDEAKPEVAKVPENKEEKTVKKTAKKK